MADRVYLSAMGSGGIGITEIIRAVAPERVVGLREARIERVACHPSTAGGPGCLFVCMDEYLEYNRWQTWRTHLERLPALGLAALVAPEPVDGLDVPQLVCREPRRAAGRAARLLNGYPDRALDVYGVTGTNGKTTTTRLLAHVLSRLGRPCGSIGTLGILFGESISEPGTYTTPLAPELYAQLARLRCAGATAASIEVSSHGLALDRVEGVEFAGAILTNIERDHLDFHGTHEAYAEAKRLLFSRVRPSGWCALNHASPFCASFSQSCSGQVVSYGGPDSAADLRLLEWDSRPDSSRFTAEFHGRRWEFATRLPGRFQIENCMGAIALLAAQGHDGEAIAAALAGFPPVLGRMERLAMPNGCTAIVDYAHNPDGLKNLLENCRPLCRGRLHVVFGCGGDRDKGKRPIMGGLAAALADVVWVTSDNPRTEDPEQIIIDIMDGMAAAGRRAEVHRMPDRAKAIRSAYAATSAADLLVVAGKGHEDYQIIGYTKHPFSDQDELRALGGR